jgi:4-diphosphocytidyl-2-C-methyl-D-erythritol kinase
VKPSEFTLPSFAKINWSLRVLGKRPDAYHEVSTVLQTVSLHDELTFSARTDDQLVLTCNDSNLPVDKANLILQAAFALKEHLHLKLGARIDLIKRIPAKAGLGGASSNAAVALLGLRHLWQVEVATPELIRIGSDLGADVPFFFAGGRALGRGTGTEVNALADISERPLIIVFPNASVATREAYEALDAASLTSFEPVSILANSFAESISTDCDQWPLQNDFEAVIFEIEPEIKRAKDALLESGARGALLAGSGSSVFGIFNSDESRQQALKTLRGETGWHIFSCDTLSRNDYFRALGPCSTPLLRSFNMLSDTGA